MIEKLKEDINILLNNGVELIPIRNIKIGKNSKQNYNKNLPKTWTNPNITRFNKDKTIKSLNDGNVGFFGRAGKRTGYIIIDVDNGKKETTHPEILTEILPELLNTCKFYVKSPNGFHFYFRDTNECFKTKHLNVYGNIDILTNENVYYFGIRDDGVYSLVKHDEIVELPEIIRNQLSQGIKLKALNKNGDLTETPYYENTSYFINNDELIKLLNMLGNEYNDDYNEWIKMSSILKKAGFKNAWDTWSKQSKKYNKLNNEKIFKYLKTDNNIPDLNYIINLLSSQSNATRGQSPKKYELITKIYKLYEPLSNNHISLITKTICEQYLKSNIYENEKDNITKSPLGTAKTFSAFDYVLINDYKILSICQLINNVDNHIREFKNHPSNKNKNRYLLSYADVPDYEVENHNAYIEGHIIENNDFSHKITGICTTIDSLVKIYKKYFMNNEKLIEEYVIYLDEIHSDLLHLLTSTTLKNKRTETLDILFQMLKRCKKIIMTDGNICDVVLTFYNSLKRPNGYDFILNEYKSFNGVNVYNKSPKGIYKILENKVKNNTFATIACNTKKQVENIYKDLNELKQKYKKDFKILCYTSTEGEKIYDVNIEWDNAFVIYSPTIISGLDFRSKMPQDVISFIDGKETINAEQVCQQICRNRNIRNVYICCSHYSNTLKYNTIEDLKDDYNKLLNSHYSCPIYKELSNKILVNHKYEYKPNDFSNLYALSVFHNNVMSSNILYYIEEILKSYGFIFHNRYLNDDVAGIDEYDDINDYEKHETEKQSIIYSDDVKYEIFYDDIENNIQIEETKYNKQLMNRFKYINLKLPTTAAEKEIFLNILNEYGDILGNPHSFNNHMSFIHFVKSFNTLKTEFINTNDKDFKEHIMNNTTSRLLNIKSIMIKYLPEIDIYDFSYDERDEKYNEPINITNAEYDYIKSFVKTKKDAPKNKRELLSVMVKCYKHILGDAIFKPAERKKKCMGDVKKRINFNIISFNDEYFKHHLELLKYSLIYSKSTKDYRTKYDKSICDILDTYEHIKKPRNSRNDFLNINPRYNETIETIETIEPMDDYKTYYNNNDFDFYIEDNIFNEMLENEP